MPTNIGVDLGGTNVRAVRLSTPPTSLPSATRRSRACPGSIRRKVILYYAYTTILEQREFRVSCTAHSAILGAASLFKNE
jgi:hypothetical protein